MIFEDAIDAVWRSYLGQNWPPQSSQDPLLYYISIEENRHGTKHNDFDFCGSREHKASLKNNLHYTSAMELGQLSASMAGLKILETLGLIQLG